MLETRIPFRWLLVVRAFFVALFLGYVLLFAAALPAYYAENRQVCGTDPCPPTAPSPEDKAALEAAGLGLDFFATYSTVIDITIVTVYAALALLIFWRGSDTWMALLTAAALVGFGVNGLTEADEALARLIPELSRLQFALSVLGVTPISLLFFIFPSGHFVPRWARWPAFGGIALYFTIIILSLSSTGLPDTAYRAPLSILITFMLIAGALTQVYRYLRVSSPVERQQTKWVVAGMAATMVPVIAWTLFVEVFSIPAGPQRIWIFLGGASVLSVFLLFLPISIAIAILRYRLWDIDVIIRRTLIYGALTGTLALIYAGAVILLQRIFPAQSQLATVLSTLAVAALFNPLRQRFQQSIDRRFYRRGYDATRILASFNSTVRVEVDLDRLSISLLTAVDETMQPDHTSLWLSDTDDRLPQS